MNAKSKTIKTLLSGVEQIALALTNFMVTWFSLRTMDFSTFGTFSIFWAVCWGGFAVLSEFLLSPNRVRSIKVRNFDSLVGIAAGSGILSLGIALSSVITSATLSPFFLTGALLFASVSFHCIRAFFQENDTSKSFLLCVSLLAVTFGSLVLISLFEPKVTIQLMLATSFISYTCSLLIVFPYKSGFKGLRNRIYDSLAVSVRNGIGFGLATLSRVLTYSILFLGLLGITQGHFALAVYSSAMAIIAPSQVFTAALSWVSLPNLVHSMSSGNIRKELRNQILIYATTALMLAIGLWIIWPWWVNFSIADQSVSFQLSAQKPLVTLLMFWIVVSALPSNALHALHAQKNQFWISLGSGIASLCILYSGVSAMLASASAYALYTICSIVVAVNKSKPGSR